MKATGNHIQLKKLWAVKVHKTLILALFILPYITFAQQTITLDECLGLASENYPLVKQSVLLNDQSRFDIEAINKGRLPKLEVNAQATYQSDVTSLPIQLPNTTIEPPNKDQYRATLDVNQLIYNGGLIDASTKVAEAKAKVSVQKIEVTLHEVKNQVVQLYLSILLKQENRALLEAKEKQLQIRLHEVRAGVKYGMLLPTSSHALEVELLKIKQNYVEIDYAKLDLIQRLSLLTDRELGKNAELQRPTVSIEPNTASKRPELLLFDLQKEQVELSTALLSKSNLPKLNAFAQGGYGNPGLNMLDNSFNPFYMAGLRLNWDVFDWKKNKSEIQALQVNKEIIDTQKETFELNNQLELVNLRSEIAEMEELISYDEAIIPLRDEMVKTAESQLKNGVITSSDFITEFTNLYEAKSNMTLHKTQLLLKQVQYRLTDGTYGKSDALN